MVQIQDALEALAPFSKRKKSTSGTSPTFIPKTHAISTKRYLDESYNSYESQIALHASAFPKR
jgi:hypothetical protein